MCCLSKYNVICAALVTQIRFYSVSADKHVDTFKSKTTRGHSHTPTEIKTNGSFTKS